MALGLAAAIAAVLVGAAWIATRARRFLRDLSMGVADLLGEWVDTT